MSDVLRVLKEARELISDEKRWTTGSLARDHSGNMVSPTNYKASCWCAVGALYKCTNNTWPAIQSLRDALVAEGTVDPVIPHFNDRKGHAATISLFDRAIAAEHTKTASPPP